MSLLKPHLGEVLDRISILSLKIEEAKLRLPEAERAHFARERDDLLHLISMWGVTAADLPNIFVWSAMLGAVNGRIWEINKQARTDRGIALIDVHPLNDMRAELVRRLGGVAGVEQPKDKVY